MSTSPTTANVVEDVVICGNVIRMRVDGLTPDWSTYLVDIPAVSEGPLKLIIQFKDNMNNGPVKRPGSPVDPDKMIAVGDSLNDKEFVPHQAKRVKVLVKTRDVSPKNYDNNTGRLIYGFKILPASPFWPPPFASFNVVDEKENILPSETVDTM
ncbi:hypothetical protein BDN67DRAFT_1012006 [Paxillus ammoniavirescens]|nr:hypothetical protein BDN67DRAFT_1012006 [Paxillus ammoniavirescens]